MRATGDLRMSTTGSGHPDRGTRSSTLDQMELAAGFATHSGWAVAVVVGLVDDHVEVHDRRRVELVSPDLPRQAYHAAADLPADDARELVAAVDTSIAEHSRKAVSAIREAVADHTIVAAGVVGAQREIPDVPTVLASHGLMHASEGEQYRRGISTAAEQLGVRVRRAEPRQLTTTVADQLGWPEGRLAEEHRRIRATLGPPWQKDHKQATEAALLALGSAAS
jgi:hypothetical protein